MRDGRYDVSIVGGGIVGLATALAVRLQYPRLRVCVLEKEDAVGMHQTGHNSGVIHSGIYYRPGSLKARLCLDGAARMRQYCAEHGVPVVPCGKVVVATRQAEVPALHELYRRGTANGVTGLRLVSPEELRDLEPEAAGVQALHSPVAAIVDYQRVVEAMAGDLRASGCDILLGCELLGARVGAAGIALATSGGTVSTRFVVNCGGLYSDRIAGMLGVDPGMRIIPFRGEYYMLRPERTGLVRGLIYPVPDPRFPFLGVHFTRTVDGGVEAGPNAVLAFAREGYTMGSVRLRDLGETARYPGFWRVARRHWQTGAGEFRRSLSKRRFTASLQELVPAVRADDLVRGGAGVRAQAVMPDGSLADDFVIRQTANSVHVLNAPSPGATASLAIGQYIAELAGTTFGLEAA